MRQTHWMLFTMILANSDLNIPQVLEEAQARRFEVMLVVKLEKRQRTKRFLFLRAFVSEAEFTFMLTNLPLTS